MKAQTIAIGGALAVSILGFAPPVMGADLHCANLKPGAMTAELLSVMTALRQAGIAVAGGALATSARDLLLALAGVSLAWYGIRMVLARGALDDLMGGLILLLFHFGLAWWLITEYRFIEEQFSGGFAWLAGAALDEHFASRPLSASSATTDALGANLQCGMQSLWRIITSLWKAAAYLSVGLFSGFGISRIVSDVIMLLELLLLMIPFFISILLYALFTVVIQFFYVVVAAVGPLFIAFTVLPRLRFLFDGWLQALLSVLLYNVLLLMMLGIGGNMIAFTLDRTLDDIERRFIVEQVEQHAGNVVGRVWRYFSGDRTDLGSPFQSFTAFSMAFLAMLFLWKMFTSIPHLARLLLSGQPLRIVRHNDAN